MSRKIYLTYLLASQYLSPAFFVCVLYATELAPTPGDPMNEWVTSKSFNVCYVIQLTQLLATLWMNDVYIFLPTFLRWTLTKFTFIIGRNLEHISPFLVPYFPIETRTKWNLVFILRFITCFLYLINSNSLYFLSNN